MKLLVLAVDRDDDLGRKTRLSGPILGRADVLEAAKTLALADPEESDANGMFAAVHEYDKISADPAAYGATGADVAIITGNVRVGSKSDAILARQFDEILAKTGSDEIILVSDGAEDESLLPILASRARIAGVRRVVIKQAKNLEGFVYLMVRLMHDEKMQRRFFLPLAFLLFAAAVSLFLNRPGLFLSAALVLTGVLILIQVFGWEEPLEAFFASIGKDVRSGKLLILSSFISLVLIVVGGWLTVTSPEVKGAAGDRLAYTLFFIRGIYWWFVAAVLVTLVGRALDVWVRERETPSRQVVFTLFFLSAAIFLRALLLGVIDWVGSGTVWTLPLLFMFTYFFFAGFLFFTALIAVHYFHTLEPTVDMVRRRSAE